MTRIPRRAVLAGAAASMGLVACGNGVGSSGAANIDARVANSLNFLDERYPGTRDLRNNAAGMLVMPLITEASFGFGGAYGRGALLVNEVTVDYYSATEASFGIQAGAQQYSHVLYFMTQEALAEFRASPGWEAGAGVQYAINDRAGNLSADTTTALTPVIAVIFGQAGLIAGASVEGTKYTRIIP